METNYQVSCQGNGQVSYQPIAKLPVGMESYLDVIAEDFEPVGDDYE